MNTDFRSLAQAEFIERLRFQFSLAERLLLALLILNAGASILRGDHWGFTAGLFASLVAYVFGFWSQHFYSLACVHEYAGSGLERTSIRRGHVFYFSGIGAAVSAILCFGIGLTA